MQTIQLLDQDTINKIAAGEVVERPASVVKELVENAIDARSSAITIEIKDGGLSMIRVTDNGSGIDKDDIDQAFKRHATSKIRSAMDLMTISSLGFRGEALSSIAAVSQVELITKTHQDLTGVRCTCHGGGDLVTEEIGCPDGTTIIVRNLFFNTPARRKFLKTPQTEGGYITDLVSHLALSHPEISFNYIINNQNKLHTSGNASLKDIIYHVYGRDVTRQLLEIHVQTDLLKIDGFLGKPILSRGNRNWENYFINARYIKSNIITRAIEDAYKTFVMVHKYPFTVLHFEISPEMIDVNVHPRKMEIRFNQNEAVYHQVYDAIRGVLTHRELIPEVTLSPAPPPEKTEKKDAPEPFEIRRLAALGQGHVSQPGAVYQPGKAAPQPAPVKVPQPQKPEDNPVNKAPDNVPEAKKPEAVKAPRQMHLSDEQFLGNDAAPAFRLIGQVFDTYWMAEYDGKLLLIDQHAAHEKVLYERLLKELSVHHTERQLLSPPAIVTLSGLQQQILKKYENELAEMAFEIEPFGGNSFAVYAVPLQLYGMDAGGIFTEILDQLTEESSNIEGSKITWHIASMACKAAVKGGSRLSVREADALIAELLAAENPYTCPHGRPTMITISKYEMEKRFKRIQS